MNFCYPTGAASSLFGCFLIQHISCSTPYMENVTLPGDIERRFHGNVDKFRFSTTNAICTDDDCASPHSTNSTDIKAREILGIENNSQQFHGIWVLTPIAVTRELNLGGKRALERAVVYKDAKKRRKGVTWANLPTSKANLKRILRKTSNLNNPNAIVNSYMSDKQAPTSCKYHCVDLQTWRRSLKHDS
ncbi:hypothetical protein K0M31_015228 [Melipona bicolor]|uniref:Uncharacterized protein n=1 Tax=Melipona bicolor TaxID=60889 RepID=A0AA40FG16_9HYME|nr:hypothetical protein K0M31_015228 [Melipona bicolor]